MVMVGAKLIEFTGNFTCGCPRACDTKDLSFISNINEKLGECGVFGFSFNGNKQESSTTTAIRCLSERRSQTNSHISMLTDMLHDETPDIYSNNNNFLLV